MTVRLFITVAVGAFLFAAPGLFGQNELPEQPWLIEQYDGSFDSEEDWEEIGARITEVSQSGFLPVGIEVRERPTVLYIRNAALPFEQWVIHEFDDPSQIEAHFGAFLDEGWLPMDIARTDNGIAALFVGAESSLSGWRMKGVEADSEVIADTIADYRADGFTPWGITATEGGVWLLLLRESGTIATDTSIQTFPSDDLEALRTGVNRELILGNFIPWGLMLAGNQATVQFIRSNEHQPDIDPEELDRLRERE